MTVVRTQPATREDIEALLKQFAQPQERLKVNWSQVRPRLIEAAKQYGLTVPPYLGGGERDG